mmetsp:Transcript_6824/g.15580  ORF Transcript_6824/g.15580 Transcript_6824/m.15580 type:complete len:81 (+) Transcript_6824:697-939(+)
MRRLRMLFFLSATHLHQRHRYGEARKAYSQACSVYDAAGVPKDHPKQTWIRRCASQRAMLGHIFWQTQQKLAPARSMTAC